VQLARETSESETVRDGDRVERERRLRLEGAGSERKRVKGEGGRRRLKEKKIDLGFFFFLLYWCELNQGRAGTRGKKKLYPKFDPTHTGWKKSNLYLQKKKNLNPTDRGRAS
jgi:hypothetical protein